MFGVSLEKLHEEYPGEIPPILQEILTYVRSTDSFAEQPNLFHADSLTKPFSKATISAAKKGLATTKFEFAKHQADPDYLMDHIFTTEELAELEEEDVCSLYVQILGGYLLSLPSPLVLSELGIKLAKKAMVEVHAAAEAGGAIDSAATASHLYEAIRGHGRELHVNALFYFLNFLAEHIMAAALYGDVTPMDIAESIHAWIFEHHPAGGEDHEEGCALALSMMIENAGELDITATKRTPKTPRSKRPPSPSLSLLTTSSSTSFNTSSSSSSAISTSNTTTSSTTTTTTTTTSGEESFVKQRISVLNENLPPPDDASLVAPSHEPPPPLPPLPLPPPPPPPLPPLLSAGAEGAPDRRATIEILENALKQATTVKANSAELEEQQSMQKMIEEREMREKAEAVKAQLEMEKAEKAEKVKQERLEQERFVLKFNLEKESLEKQKAEKEKAEIEEADRLAVAAAAAQKERQQEAKKAREAAAQLAILEQKKIEEEEKKAVAVAKAIQAERIRKEFERETEQEKLRIKQWELEQEQLKKNALETEAKEQKEQQRRVEEEHERAVAAAVAAALKKREEEETATVAAAVTTALQKREEEEKHQAAMVAAELEYKSLMTTKHVPPPLQQQQQQHVPPPSPSQLPPPPSPLPPPHVPLEPVELPDASRHATSKEIEAEILQNMMDSVQEEARKEEEKERKEMEDAMQEDNAAWGEVDVDATVVGAERALGEAMLSLREHMVDMKSSTSNLLNAYRTTTNEAKRLSNVYQESKQQRINVRQTLMLESSKLVQGLRNSRDHRSTQLLLMNRMLQETHTQLLEEHEETKQMLEKSLLPSTLRTSLNVSAVTSSTLDVTNELTKCEGIMMKCAMIISNSRKTQHSNDGDSGNRHDQYFEGQSVRASMNELKGLRSEVIRLRHALNANSSSSSSSSKSEKHFNRETADAQVIRDLKAEVSTLRSAVHKANLSNQNSRSPGSGGRDVTTVDSNTYSIMQQQLRDLQNRERIQNDELIAMKQSNSNISKELSMLRANVKDDISNAKTMYNRKVYELDAMSKKLFSLQAAYDALVPYAKRMAVQASSPTSNFSTLMFSSSTSSSSVTSSSFTALDTTSRSTLMQGVGELQQQLKDAHARNVHLQQMVEEANGESTAMRAQYLQRVGEHRDETSALLKNHGQRDRLRTRHAALRLVGRRIYYALHTMPLRRSFMKWIGHTSKDFMKQKNHQTRYQINRLTIENDELGRHLRREQATNRSLQGRLQAHSSYSQSTAAASSVDTRSVDTRSVDMRSVDMRSVGTTRERKTNGLEMELDRVRNNYRQLVLENQKYKISEERAREAENIIRKQLENLNHGLNYGNAINRGGGSNSTNGNTSFRGSSAGYNSSSQNNNNSAVSNSAAAATRLPKSQMSVSGIPLSQRSRNTTDNNNVRWSRPPSSVLYSASSTASSAAASAAAPSSYTSTPGPPTSDNRPPPPPLQQTPPQSVSPQSMSRSVLGFGVTRIETKDDRNDQDNSNRNRNNEKSSSFRRGSFFGTYQGSGGRIEEKKDSIQWAHSKKDMLERVHLQESRGVNPRQQQRELLKNPKRRARRRKSLSTQQIL